uniref:DUF6876 family protein n=1 Tax=Flavobacterium sp. TaxID=239 RepID=UPI004047A738
MDAKNPQALSAVTLAQFTGTAQYWCVARQFVITDGVKYLAESAACFWLIDAAISHLLEIGTCDWFVLVRTEVSGSSAVMIYEDGNGSEHARQEIAYTDLPLSSVRLYAVWDSERWVIMLPSEY